MNGRLYDPLVGRFLNADPFIQDPGFTQSFNRYSYVLNNPLKYNDPSGYYAQGFGRYGIAFDWSPFSSGGYGGGDSGGGGGGGGYWETVTTIVTEYSYVGAGSSDLLLKGSHQKKVEREIWVANYGGDNVGQPGFGESLIPVWGSGRTAINAFQNGNYWTGIGYGALAVTDVFLVKAAVTAVAKGTITLAAKYALREAVANPIMTQGEKLAAQNVPRVAAMMEGKGIDRAFRIAADNNLILRPAQSIGLLELSPMNRGADMVGRGILEGTWWDVTTSRAWGAHVAKYGLGGIGLIY